MGNVGLVASGFIEADDRVNLASITRSRYTAGATDVIWPESCSVKWWCS